MEDGAATVALFSDPQGIAVSETHNCLYVADYSYAVTYWLSLFFNCFIWLSVGIMRFGASI